MEEGTKRRVLITGGTSGLGLETGKILLKDGWKVCITGRKLHENNNFDCNYLFIKADFSKFSDVVSAAEKVTEAIGIPDIIINNAGILTPPDFSISNDGFELSYQVNFLSHLLLNELFIKNLNDDHRIKIISVTSPVYRYARPRFIIPERRNYAAFKAYTESKYYLLMLGHFFKEKYPEKNIDFIGFNPGTFSSGIYRMQGGFFKTLYHIAAPFMRSSKRVAHNFVNVIRNENLVSGRIYRSVNKSVDFKDPYKSESVKFLFHCSGIISDYLHI